MSPVKEKIPKIKRKSRGKYKKPPRIESLWLFKTPLKFRALINKKAGFPASGIILRLSSYYHTNFSQNVNYWLTLC